MTYPWSLVSPVSAILDGAVGLNISYVGRVPKDGDSHGDPRALLQLVGDPHFDEEAPPTRRVTRVALQTSEARTPLVHARLTRTFGADEDETALELGVLTARDGRAELLIEVFPAADPDPADDAGRSSTQRVSRSVASCQIYEGRNRFLHDFRAANLRTDRYLISLAVAVNGRPELDVDLPFYKLRREDVESLRERYDRSVSRLTGRLHQALPSVAIRFAWLEELRAGLDPGGDPGVLRRIYDETCGLVAAIESGRDPFAGSAGYQRRGFRSKIDGSLQPYSLHIPAVAVEDPHGRYPLLVMLHGSGVDEVGTATGKGLVRELETRGWLLCAPLGRDTSGWYLGGGGRDILEALEAARAVLPVDDRAVFLAGFSMGGFGVWRHGPESRHRFAGLAVLSGPTRCPKGASGRAGPGAPDPDDPALQLEKAAGLPIFVAQGELDRAVPVQGAREFAARAAEAGAVVVYREYPGAGHGDYEPWGDLFDWMEGVRRGEAGPPEGE